MPPAAVAVVAIVALATILTQVSGTKGSTREDVRRARGWAEITVTRYGCAVEPTSAVNVVGCVKSGPDQFIISFTKSLAGRTVVASRSAASPGTVGASITTDTTVLAVFPRLDSHRVRASVLVP
jgi:hypothetical protein